ncbi:MAG: hypothetical protein MUE77_09695 [Sandarakinorhabdus sp.]|jgi:hypothetical protein|nr:hypothetical protein [Sandarakinorhabdus sp.]
MKSITILDACLVAGGHVAAGAVLAIPTDVDAETAAFLVRHGRAAETDGEEITDHGKLSVAELKELADKLGLTLPAGAKKADIIALIEAHGTGPDPAAA